MRPAKLLLAAVLLLTGCDTVSTAFVENRDLHPANMAGVRNVALATVAARPSEAANVFTSRAELASAMNVFETELVNALTNRGMGVVAPTISFSAFNGGLSYETAYAMAEPNIASRAQTDEEITWMAKRLKERVPSPISKPSGLLMTNSRDNASNMLSSDGMNPMLSMKDEKSRITSINTRLFPQMSEPPYVTLPRNTEQGGALDNRFASQAARKAIGQIASQAGADSYLLVDGQLTLSTREEGAMLAGFTGGTRFVTFDGMAMLVKADGSIAAVDRVRGQSAMPIGGRSQQSYTPEHGKGPLGYYAAPNLDNLREGAYQAVRDAALKLADAYAVHRGMKIDD